MAHPRHGSHSTGDSSLVISFTILDTTIGVGAYEFTPKLAGQLTVLVFALDLGDFSGSLFEADAFMAYQLSKHFGIGGGLKYFNLELQASTSRGGSVEYKFEFFGPAIFGYASF